MIHLLSGVSGWGYPGRRRGLGHDDRPAPLQDGSTEDHLLKNGVHFADYIRQVDVPGSKLAFLLRGKQIRYLTIDPKRVTSRSRRSSSSRGRTRPLPS